MTTLAADPRNRRRLSLCPLGAANGGGSRLSSAALSCRAFDGRILRGAHRVRQLRRMSFVVKIALQSVVGVISTTIIRQMRNAKPLAGSIRLRSSVLGWAIATLYSCTPIDEQPTPVPESDASTTETRTDSQGASGAGGSSGSGAISTAGSDGSKGTSPCSSEGSVRCTGVTGQREACKGGFWSAAEPCPQGEVCTASAPGEQSTCQAVAEVCKGNGGRFVCDGGGVLYKCDAAGLVETKTSCATARHCQAERGACAQCVPGGADGHMCKGAELLRCADDGGGYVSDQTCPTEALCNAKAGDCTDKACSAGQKVCDGDVLKQCNASLTELDTVMSCQAGLCDGAAGSCDTCAPGSAKCEGGNMSVVCSADGTTLNRTACPADAPICVGNGKCVQCGATSDCAAPGACMQVSCNLATGQCEPTPAPVNTRCGGDSFCDGNGSCVGCTTAEQCGDPGPCNRRACISGRCQPEPLSTGTCPDGFCAAGSCVECRTAADCGTAAECRQWECNDNTCDEVDRSGTCRTGASSGTCSGGACRECVVDRDCTGNAGECQRFTCSSFSCETVGTSSGTCSFTPSVTGTCSAGMCTCNRNCAGRCGGSDGCGGTCPNNCSGNTPTCDSTTNTCVECVTGQHEQCALGEECRSDACRLAVTFWDLCSSSSACQTCNADTECFPDNSFWPMQCVGNLADIGNHSAGQPVCLVRCQSGTCPSGYGCTSIADANSDGTTGTASVCIPNSW